MNSRNYEDYKIKSGYFPSKLNYRDEITWQIGVEYLLSRNFSLMASYDNRFGGGGGLSVKF